MIKKFFPFFVLFLVFIVYLPCLKAGFVNWDDDIHLLQNFTLRSLQWPNLLEIWTSTVSHTYIPLTTTTWAIEYYFFGFNPFIFHLNNIILHLVVTALVFVFSRRMGLSSVASAIAALVFGIHPIHVESVAWVTERKDILYTVFFMLALLVYLRYLDTKCRKYFWLTVFLAVMSICAKPMAVSLPLVLLVLDWFRHRNLTLPVIFEKVFCAVPLIPIAFATYLPNSYLVESAVGQDPIIWIWCFIFYLFKFIFPWPLTQYYWFPLPISIFNFMYLLSVLVFAGLLAALWFFRRNRLFVFALVFYFTNIFYLLRFHPILDLIHDRYMYAASIGLCMFLAASIEKIFILVQGRRFYLNTFKTVVFLLAVLLSVMTWKQCEIWQTSVKLWSHQLQYNSKTGTWLAYCKLAGAYAAADGRVTSDIRRFDHIRSLYQKSIDLSPDFAEPYFGLGNLYESAGDRDNAEHYYKETIARHPEHFEAYFKLGRIYQRKGLPEQTIHYYRKAMIASPGNIYLHSDIQDAYNDSIRMQDNADVYKNEKSKKPEGQSSMDFSPSRNE